MTLPKDEEIGPAIIIDDPIDTRCKFILNFPIHKRIWRLLAGAKRMVLL